MLVIAIRTGAPAPLMAGASDPMFGILRVLRKNKNQCGTQACPSFFT